MKNILLVITIACAALFLSQCKKSIVEQPNGNLSGETIEVSLNVDNGGGTKTDIDGLSVSWEIGDKLHVVGSEDGLLGFVSAQNSGTSAYFTGTISKGTKTQNFHFYYVGNEDKVFVLDNGNYTYSISSQEGTLDDIEDNLHLMHGVVNGVTVGQTDLGNITMKNVMSIVNLKFSRNDGLPLISSVKCTGAYSSLTFDAKDGFNLNGYPVTEVSRNSGEINLSGVSSGNYYMAVIPDDQVQVLNFTQGVCGKLASHAFEPNLIYNEKSIGMERLPYVYSKFTVSTDKKVMFSIGNLQYRATANGVAGDLTHQTVDGPKNGEFRFAEHQYEFVGDGGTTIGNVSGSDNRQISETYSGWIDLFGWGTSGRNPSNTYYLPWHNDYPSSATTTLSNYGKLYGPSGAQSLTGSNANSDWGVYNDISNDVSLGVGAWRIMTASEWTNLLGRKDDNNEFLYGFGYCITSTNKGLILLPDEWDWSKVPSGFPTFTHGTSVWANGYTDTQWSTMESLGAVFLPITGFRGGKSIYDTNLGYYWSSSNYGIDQAIDLRFGYGSSSPVLNAAANFYRCAAFAVRLVKDATDDGNGSANPLEPESW